MARPIKIKESDLTNMVKRILTEKGVVNEKHYGCGCRCYNCGGVYWACGGTGCYSLDPWWDQIAGKMVEPNEDGSNVPDELKYRGEERLEGKELDNWLDNTKREYESKHDRGKFDGRASKVIGVDSDIEDQRFEKNMKEGYRKYGCKFLQSRKSLNEDKLTNLFETDRNIREQNILSKKLRFIESAIKHTKCGTILREQEETTPNNRNDYRRTRKLIYENMDWEAVRRNNNRRLRK